MFNFLAKILKSLFRSYKFLNFLAGFAFTCVLIAGLYFAKPNRFKFQTSSFQDSVTETSETLGAPLRWAEKGLEKAGAFYDAAAEAEIVRKEIERIPAWTAALEALKKENATLRALLKTPLPPETEVTSARVIMNAKTIFSQTFTINAGANQGVRVNALASDPYGLVGRVIKTHPNRSVILPVRHAVSKLAATVSRNGVKLLISGRNLRDPVAEFVSDYSGLRKGDKIVTMGDGETVPSDIPVGEIIDPTENPVRVRLFAKDRSPDYLRITQLNPDAPKSDDTLAKKKEKTDADQKEARR